MNFGLLLTSTINDKDNINAKKKFLMNLNKYREDKLKEQDDILNKMNYYNNHYQKKRENNDEIYLNYIQTFTELKENWIKSNKENDLEKLKNLNKPILLNIDDIYTYMIIKNKNFKN
jgi:hypothetical protein